jgi:5,10-methylene-tetrahydrofolate dehydrogenase/methenyl tetrahydrofolate cyclohydrolase
MATLSQQLSEMGAIPFPQLTFLKAKPVLKDIAAITSEQAIDKEVKKLSSQEADALMKTLYVGLANDSGNSSVYFKWHAALYQAAGPGTVIRTLTEQKSE